MKPVTISLTTKREHSEKITSVDVLSDSEQEIGELAENCIEKVRDVLEKSAVVKIFKLLTERYLFLNILNILGFSYIITVT